MTKPTKLTSVPDETEHDGPPAPPAGLKTAGRSLWSSVLGGWEIDPWERLLLLQACRCADRLDDLAEIASQSEAVVVNSKGDPVAHALLLS